MSKHAVQQSSDFNPTIDIASLLKSYDVKASFRICSIKERKFFYKSSCIIPVSIMGGKEHTGKRFYATMKLVNNSFKSCEILLGDSLHRHTLRIWNPKATKEALYLKAKQASEQWLQENIIAVRQLNIPFKLTVWDDYLREPGLDKYIYAVKELYKTDKEYQQAIISNANEYIQRCKDRDLICKTNEDQAMLESIKYIKEECAVMCLWAAEKQFDFEVYPAGRCPALAATYERLILPNYPELLRPVALRFKK